MSEWQIFLQDGYDVIVPGTTTYTNIYPEGLYELFLVNDEDRVEGVYPNYQAAIRTDIDSSLPAHDYEVITNKGMKVYLELADGMNLQTTATPFFEMVMFDCEGNLKALFPNHQAARKVRPNVEVYKEFGGIDSEMAQMHYQNLRISLVEPLID